MFNSENLSIVSKYFYGLLLIVFCIQIIISDSFDTVFVIFLLTISNIVTTYYCFNKKYFFQFPISLFIIFVSNFTNFGGALFIKTYELSPVTDKMFEPIKTMVFLFIVSLLLIAVHYCYMKSYTLNKIKGSINHFFTRIGLFEVVNNNFLYFIGIIGIFTVLFYSGLTEIARSEKGTEPALYQNIFQGLKVFKFALIITLFSSKLNNISHEDKKNWIFILGLFLLMFASFTFSVRAVFFDFLFVILLVYAFLFVLGLIETGRYTFFKFILIIAFAIPSLNYIEHVSNIFLLQKIQSTNISRLENIKQTISSLISPSKQKEVRYEIIELKDTAIIRAIEKNKEYFEHKIFTRFSIVPRHDFFYFISERLTEYQIKEIKKDFAPRIISLIPQPLISLFSDFKKKDYLGSSVGSYISGFYDERYGASQDTSSMLVNVKIYFGFFWPLALIILSIISFTLFDSFFKYEKKIIIISPILIILFYSTGSGIINFFSSVSLDTTAGFLLRKIPQTIILYIILKYFYQRIVLMKK